LKNNSKDMVRIRFMLGRHADVLDLACSEKEVADIGRELGYCGHSDAEAEEFALARVREATAAFERLLATDRKARAYGERHKMPDSEFADFLEQIDGRAASVAAGRIDVQVSTLEGARA
jgi:hypothetical protein